MYSYRHLCFSIFLLVLTCIGITIVFGDCDPTTTDNDPCISEVSLPISVPDSNKPTEWEEIEGCESKVYPVVVKDTRGRDINLLMTEDCAGDITFKRAPIQGTEWVEPSEIYWE